MIITLKSKNITAKIAPLGGRLVSCEVDGREYVYGAGTDDNPGGADLYSGVICGRHAGRVTNAEFPLDGKQIKLSANRPPYHIHGGFNSFAHRVWDHSQDGNRLALKLQSPDGEEGYPGALDVQAVYALNGNVLSLSFEATTTKPTLVNLTNHAYWNLAASTSVLSHELQVNGDKYFPLDDNMLPLGRMDEVADTRWDFRKARLIAEDYDNAFLLNGKHGEMKQALRLRDPNSGRAMEVWTTERCVQIYTAWHWEPSVVARSGPICRSQALAIEPQNVADAPNNPGFPSSFLRPGETYRNAMEWRFS
jgi:aldose 1-epimerase